MLVLVIIVPKLDFIFREETPLLDYKLGLLLMQELTLKIVGELSDGIKDMM